MASLKRPLSPKPPPKPSTDKRPNVYVIQEWPLYDAFGWTVDNVQAVLEALNWGNLLTAESLMLAMTRDPAYAHGMKTRCQEMARVPHELVWEGGVPARQRKELEAHLPNLFEGGAGPNALATLTKYRCAMGVAPGAISWQRSPTGRTWLPTIHAREAGWLTYFPTEERYRFSARDGLRDVVPDGREWVLFCEMSSRYPHQEGNIRPLAALWWLKSAVIRYWGQYNKTHGNPQKKVKGPAQQREQEQPDGSPGDVENLISLAQRLVGGDVIFLPQYGADGPNFDFELVEATAKTWETFPSFIAYVDKWITLLWLGAWDNTQGDAAGSRARAEVHERVSLRYLSADCEITSAALDVVWRQWCRYNKLDPADAPHSKFLWEPPEDKKLAAEIRNINAQAAEKACAAAQVIEMNGVKVDWRALAEEHGLVTLPGEPEQQLQLEPEPQEQPEAEQVSDEGSPAE